jgi:hypothetical protein
MSPVHEACRRVGLVEVPDLLGLDIRHDGGWHLEALRRDELELHVIKSKKARELHTQSMSDQIGNSVGAGVPNASG